MRLINNDPYEGASHLPDIFMFKPVFAGDKLIAYVCAMSHHTDMGGRVPGSNACDSTEIYQEGLRIPPLKLHERGKPNDTLLRILRKAVRVPDMVLGDVQAQIAALRLGEQELLRLVERYGEDALLSLQEELLDYTEHLTRLGIEALPSGSWQFTDYVDDDGFGAGPIAIVTNLSKQGSEIAVDFSGSSPQVRGAINVTLHSAKAMVYAVVRTVVGGDIPNTGGYFRPVTVTAPEGSFVNPRLPAPVAARYLGCLRVSQSVFGAFARMLPDVIPACPGGCDSVITMAGYRGDGESRKAWVQVEGGCEIASGGSGARDGMDAQSTPVSNITNIPAELIEADYPIRIEEYALMPDTEGPGKYRGGVGLVRQYRFLADDTLVQLRADRMRHPPYGLSDGRAAPPARVSMTEHKNGECREMPSKFIATANKGDVLRLEMPGGGGWGNPLDRDPARVLADVVEEKVSRRRAENAYGVVLDDVDRRIDADATDKLRATRRDHEAAPIRPSTAAD